MRRLAFTQLLVAILIFLGMLSAYGVWYASVGKASAHVAALTKEISVKSQDSARIRAAKEALASLSTDETVMQDYLVDQESIVSFLEGLEETGTGLGSTVEVVSVSAETEPRNHITLSVRMSGSFDSVLRTIGSIEYGPYDSRLQSLTFDTAVAGAAEGTKPWTAVATFTFGTTAP